MLKPYTRYAALRDDGSPVCQSHQDDEETPLISDTLEGLFDILGDWCDCGSDYVLEHTTPGGCFVDKEGGGETVYIIRQEVVTSPLDKADLLEIERIRRQDKLDEIASRKKYPKIYADGCPICHPEATSHVYEDEYLCAEFGGPCKRDD